MQRKRKVVIIVPMQDNDDDIKQRVKQCIVLLYIMTSIILLKEISANK